MRTAISTFVLAIVAAFALAGPASAQIEVTEEATGNHCSAVSLSGHTVSGGCVVAAQTEAGAPATLSAHIPGSGESVFSVCDNSFGGHVQETGHGFIDNQSLSGASCALTPCQEAGAVNKPWPLYMHEFANQLSLVTSFCVNSPAGESVCSVDLTIVDDGDHAYEVRNRAVATGSRCSQNPAVSLAGHWIFSGGTAIEIAHEEAE